MFSQQFSLVPFLNIHSHVNKANEESDETLMYIKKNFTLLRSYH